MSYKIIEITDWERDDRTERAYYGHISYSDIMHLELEEYKKKVENGEWPGLPFVCEAESEFDALGNYNEQFCDGDFYKATDAEIEEEQYGNHHSDDERRA